MKKIIAAAVATAFVAPAFAADVTLSGYVGYVYSSTDAADDNIKHDDNNVTVTAVEELDNGLSVKATFKIIEDQSATDGDLETDGTNLAISGPFGTLNVGDVNSAMDGTGDWTDVAPYNGGFGGDGADATVNYTLPEIAAGLKIQVSMSPKGTNDVAEHSGVANDESGVSLTYSNGPVAVYAATSDIGTKSYEAAGVKFSANGLMVAYERMNANNIGTSADSDVLGSSYTAWDVGNEITASGVAVTYSMGQITLGAESQEVKEQGQAADRDENVYFVKYNVGGGLNVFAEQKSDNKATSPDDATAVGITFAF